MTNTSLSVIADHGPLTLSLSPSPWGSGIPSEIRSSRLLQPCKVVACVGLDGMRGRVDRERETKRETELKREVRYRASARICHSFVMRSRDDPSSPCVSKQQSK